jgi:leucine-rich repeat protein SHOC2
LAGNQLATIPENIGDLSSLRYLYLSDNQLTMLPINVSNLCSLTFLDLNDNSIANLWVLGSLPKLTLVKFINVFLSRRYWTKLSEWKSEWLLDEENAEIRQILIQQIGYEKICQELDTIELDSWREYTLLKIDDIEIVYDEDDEDNYVEISREPMVLLKMNCPSTGHIQILRVPPEMTSAEAAITWVNHGIHPDEFTV